MLIILQYADEATASAALIAAGKTLTDDDVLFTGILPTPVELGSETMEDKYYVIVNTFTLPTALYNDEYDYSYPVAGNLAFNL